MYKSLFSCLFCPWKLLTIKGKILYPTALTAHSGQKLQIRIMNLSVDLSRGIMILLFPTFSLQVIQWHMNKTKSTRWMHTVCINISSVLEFQRWWVLKSELFGQESTCHQGKTLKKFLRVMTVCQKVPKLYFESQFSMSKIDGIFSKKKIIL